MRLDSLHLQNFRGYENRTFSFHPRFNLVVGDNGAGKTSLLEACSIAIGSWMLGIPGVDSRNIAPGDVRRVLDFVEKRYRELPQYPVSVTASGAVHVAKASRAANGQIEYEPLSATGQPNPRESDVTWLRSIEAPSGRTTRVGANDLKKKATVMAKSVLQQQPYVLPLIRYFGAGRLWERVLPSKTLGRLSGKQPAELAADADEIDKALWLENRLSEPFHGYHMSLDRRCNAEDLLRWMYVERRNELDQQTESAALRLVHQAIESMLPEVETARYAILLKTLVLVYENGEIHTFADLSDGYRNVVTIAADLAIKASMLNPQLAEKALEFTPGVVLIDELDLHLHPKWQRRIIDDLRRTFPNMQFICTTHSPQLIGQAKPEEIIMLDVASAHPAQSLGMDSNWVLRHIMGSDDRDPSVAAELDAIFEHIDRSNFEPAQQAVDSLRSRIGEHPELVEAQALIDRYTRFSSSIAGE